MVSNTLTQQYPTPNINNNKNEDCLRTVVIPELRNIFFKKKVHKQWTYEKRFWTWKIIYLEQISLVAGTDSQS